MANLKEIRAKVTSIQSTQKITRAMQMVAASKMRRAQERMSVGRPMLIVCAGLFRIWCTPHQIINIRIW